MEFTVTRIIKVDINDIVEECALLNFCDYADIEQAVNSYVCCMDDIDYYFITDKIKEQICQEVVNELHRRTLK